MEDWLWWRDGVIYSIYLHSYRDGNHDGIGDVDGLESRLDYLVELGVDALCLIMDYIPNDYASIDPLQDSLESFDRLINHAHKRNLRIILELNLGLFPRDCQVAIIQFWCDHGVDGFCLDATAIHSQQEIGTDLMPYLEDIRFLLDSYPDRFLLVRILGSKPGLEGLRFMHSELHSALLELIPHGGWSAAKLMHSILAFEDIFGPENYPVYMLGSHDLPRVASRIGRGENNLRLKAAATLGLTLRGTPYVFYGEEIGMRNIIPGYLVFLNQIGFLLQRSTKKYFSSVEPMQWDETDFAGFGTARPWVPVNPDHTYRNVSDQVKDPDSLLNYYKKLINLRKQIPALRNGMFLPLTYDPQTLLAYSRQTKEQNAVVVLNFSRRNNRLVLGGQLARSKWHLLLSSTIKSSPEIHSGTLWLHPEEACVLLQD